MRKETFDLGMSGAGEHIKVRWLSLEAPANGLLAP
ncbi:unnamed protein product, partial [Allacma fusca]